MRTTRLPFLILAALSLVTGLLAGLHRIGWTLPLNGASIDHGAIMVGGFLGTLITLEKVIPLNKRILYIFPILSGGSVILFLLGMPAYSIIFLLLASAGLSVVFLLYLVRERSMIYVMMFVGALCWLAGNILLAKGGFYPASLPWWMAFVLLIIMAERLELMKFLPVSTAHKFVLIGFLLIFLAGCMLTFHGLGNYFAAIALIGASLWLMRYDVVGINLRKEKLTKFVGIALLSGYVALLLNGVFILTTLNRPMSYDILIHGFFIGFVFSMIFAHGPIILPGVLGISIKPYHPILYLWLTLLHLSWILRTTSDIILDMQLRKVTGLISAVAILGYFFSIATITIRSLRAKAV